MMLRTSLSFSLLGIGAAAAMSACTVTNSATGGGDTGDGGASGTSDGGGSANGGADGGSATFTGDHGPYPAPHATMPVVKSGGGAVIKAPHLVPVFFTGDSLQSELTTFLGALPTSQFFAANVSEYGVGAGDMGAPVILAPSTLGASMTMDTIATFMSGTVAPKATLTADTLFVVYLPASTTVDIGDGHVTCQDVGGFHESTTASGTSFAYAIIPRCQSFVGRQPHLDTLTDFLTASSTHEIMEAATDPFPDNAPAYNDLDNEHEIWKYLLGGAEIGDMCAQTPESFGPNAELGVTVQRGWSNAAAAAGHDPCVPAPSPATQPFFGAALAPTDAIQISASVTTKALLMTVGQTKTFDVTLFSEGPTNGAIDVQALGLTMGELSLSFDKSSGYNGDVLKLTVTLNSMPAQGLSPFFIVATNNGIRQIWPVGVVAE